MSATKIQMLRSKPGATPSGFKTQIYRKGNIYDIPGNISASLAAHFIEIGVAESVGQTPPPANAPTTKRKYVRKKKREAVENRESRPPIEDRDSFPLVAPALEEDAEKEDADAENREE